MVSLRFHGAAGCVTGSRFHLEIERRSLLVDCGMFQGLKELRARNWEKPQFDPGKLDAVVLSHAHLDHSGWLPRLVKLGFRGPIWCTRATVELAALLLEDSAKIQAEDADDANAHGYSKHHPAQPLYTIEDVKRTVGQLRAVRYEAPFEPVPGVRARLVPAGHIVGSAMVALEVADRTPPLRLLFSGDVGRYDAPLVPDPAPPPACDELIVESTYGDRLHSKLGAEPVLAEILKRAAARRGTVLIPAFAVGRAQQMIFQLRGLMDRGLAPSMAIHLDSPMAIEATEIYRRHAEEAGLEKVALRDGARLLYAREVYLHDSHEESMRLNKLAGPRVILSSSGMLAGGRVLHHLRRLLPEPQNVVVLVGYQAEGTRGRTLLQGAKFLRMHGQDVPVRAEIAEVPGLSGHADQDELVRWLRGLPAPPKRTFVVHGEPVASATLAQRLEKELSFRCTIPGHLDRFEC
jgi:metallo-beta-lactamase family protein